MGLEQNNEQHYREVVDKYHDPDDSYSMTTRDYVMRPSADGDNGPFTIILPPVAEAKGRFYSIIAQKADNTNFITITDNNDSEGTGEDVVLNEKGRGTIFYSDGMKWHYGSEHFTSSLTAGAVNLKECHLILDTDGLATADACICRLEVTAAIGNSAGAGFYQVNFNDADARVGGLSYALGAEMILPNNAAIASGHYTCVDHEMATGAVTNWGGGTKVSYMRFDDWGDQPEEFAAAAFFFTLAGTRLAGNMISLNAHTIKMQFETDALKTRYLVCSEYEDRIHLGTRVGDGYNAVSGDGLIEAQSHVDGASADGWFTCGDFRLTVEPDYSPAGGSVIALEAQLRIEGGSVVYSGGDVNCGIKAKYWTDGIASVSVTNGLHGAMDAMLEMGNNYAQTLTSDVACLFCISNINGGASFQVYAGYYQQLSGIVIARIGGHILGSALKISADTAQCFLTASDDGTMCSLTGDGYGVDEQPTGWLKLHIDGDVRYIYLYSGIA